MSTTSSQPPHTGGYRLKFDRDEFVQVVGIAKPKRIYRVKNIYYFAFDGFVMYTDKCSSQDIAAIQIIDATEFSNGAWSKR